MAAEASSSDMAIHGTLNLLQTRLQRLEFLLTGSSTLDGFAHVPPQPERDDETVRARLCKLEADLDKLGRLDGPTGAWVRAIEGLCSRYPDLFSTSSVHDDALPRSEDLSTLASIVLSYATLYPETASRLSSLQTLQVPTAEQSARLIQLQPRLEECQKHEAEMEEEMRELRERSARCLEWWVKVGVVGIGDMWEQCERRIQEVERRLARCERRKREEDGYV